MHSNNFDFLRFILAFTVVLAHIVDLSANEQLAFLGPYFDSYFAVTSFFLISGFLITRSAIYTGNIKKYFKKRAARLLPAYIFVIFACAILLSTVSSLDHSAYFTNSGLYKYMTFNLFFLNFIHPCLPGVFEGNKLCAVNGALWTIKVEVAFYVIVPFIIYLVNKNRNVFFIAIYCLSLIYKFLFEYYYNQTNIPIYNILSHQLPAFMTYFVCGMAFHYKFDTFMKFKNILILIAIPLFITEQILDLEILRPITQSIIIFYFAYGFKFLNNFGKYGDLSYGIYIFHFPIVQTFVSFNAFSKYNPWVVSLVVILIILVIAMLSWHFLEKRFLAKAKKPFPLVNPANSRAKADNESQPSLPIKF